MSVLGEDTKQLIRESVDIEALLKVLGFSISRVTSSEIRAPCILHGGDNQTGFSIRLDTRKWRCFTKRCEENALGRTDNDLFALVMKARSVSFMDAVQYLSDFSGLHLDVRNLTVEKTAEYRQQQDMSRYIKSMGRITNRASRLSALSEDLIAEYVAAQDGFFLESGFKPETLATFEVGSMVDRFGVRRATIPIRDIEGRLVSLSGRREDGDEEPRYLLEYEFQKGKVLYNLHRAIHTNDETIVLVEGFKALWAVHEAGFHNVAACMGANITEDQVLTLCTTNFRNCLLMYDGDAAGTAGTISAERKLRVAFNTVVVTLPHGKAPDGFHRDELRDLLQLYMCAF